MTDDEWHILAQQAHNRSTFQHQTTVTRERRLKIPRKFPEWMMRIAIASADNKETSK